MTTNEYSVKSFPCENNLPINIHIYLSLAPRSTVSGGFNSQIEYSS